MLRVNKVVGVQLALAERNPPNLLINAQGEVPTGGWKNGMLSPYVYIVPPADGIWDFEFYATPPSGMTIQVISSIDATFEVQGIDLENFWGPKLPLNGVRIHSFGNAIETTLENKVEPVKLL